MVWNIPWFNKFFKLFHIFPHFIHLPYISNDTISNITGRCAYQPSRGHSNHMASHQVMNFDDLSYSIFLFHWRHWLVKYQDWSISWPVLTKIKGICWTFNWKLYQFKAFLLSKLSLTESWLRRKRKPIKAKL